MNPLCATSLLLLAILPSSFDSREASHTLQQPPEVDAVTSTLDSAKKAYTSARSKAVSEWESACDSEEKAAKDNKKKLAVEAQLAKLEEIRSDKKMVVETGAVPKSPELKTAFDSYRKRISAACSKCSETFDSVAESQMKAGKEDSARAILNQKRDFLGASPDASAGVGAEANEASERVRAPVTHASKNIDPTASVHSGKWTVVDGELIGQDDDPGQDTAAIAFGDNSWQDYDLTLKLKADLLPDSSTPPAHAGPSLRVHVGDRNNWSQISLAPTYSGVTRRINGAWSAIVGSKGFMQFGRWYEMRIVVRGTSVQAFYDGTPLVTFDSEPFNHGQIGIQCQNSIVRCKDIKLTDANGVVLWDRLPKIK
jgi:hypothetical protein